MSPPSPVAAVISRPPAAPGAGSVPAMQTPHVRRPPAPRADGLTPVQRNLMVAGIVAAHVGAGWGLMQVQQVREAVADVAPMFVDLITPAPPPPVPPPPPPPPPKPQPIQKKAPPVPIIAAPPAPTPSPQAFEVPVEPAPPAPPPPPVAVAAAPAPPAPPAPPRTLPSSALQFVIAPPLQYPNVSKRLQESGTTLVRFYVDEAGQPHNAQVSRSSGFERLDAAALAAVQKSRLKPYVDNGVATAGWVIVPLKFELEN